MPTRIEFAEGFDWDEGNANKNRIKHGVDISECEQAFFNHKVIYDDQSHSTNEEKRYKVLGITNGRRKLALAITVRNNRIRVIMARDQSKKERLLFDNRYEDKEEQDE